jgi:1-deoxy-D-xylulose-5-phosphate synthase
VVAIYSTFLQRAFDQLVINSALQNLHMVFCIDRAGIVGADGPTHNGVLDLAYLRMIPNMCVMAPSSARELRDMLHTALRMDGPVAIRYPRGSAEGDALGDPIELEVGKGTIVKHAGETLDDMLGARDAAEGNDKPASAGLEAASEDTKTVGILAVGKMVTSALCVAAALEQEGIRCSVADMRFVKPLDEDLVRQTVSESDLVVTLEEGTEVGGFGSGVLEFLAREGISANTLVLGLPDAFLPQGTRDQVLEDVRMDDAGIAERIIRRLSQLS